MKRLLALVFSITLMILVSGCSSDEKQTDAQSVQGDEKQKVINSKIYDKKEKRLAYIVSDVRIPFWEIMSRGIKTQAQKLGYEIDIYTSENILKNEIKNSADAIKKRVDGIVLSPISSSSAVTILKLASKADIPVVISDIGADSDNYVSYISSNNYDGAYKIGKVLVQKLKELNWQDGTVGIVSIPQKRSNGKARTEGFLKALKESGIQSSALHQQVDFSYKETYDFSKTIIESDPNLRAIWLQGSDRYQGALDAIKDAGKEGEILLICFDAEPEFLDMIEEGKLVGSAMQQPYLMGKKAVEILDMHLNNKDVKKEIQLDILAISKNNIKENLSLIKLNVFGVEE